MEPFEMFQFCFLNELMGGGKMAKTGIEYV